MFGKVRESPQNEKTPFHPRSPYGISKVAGFDLTRNYREAYGLFAVSGILFNHESPRRGFEFVSRKITSHAAMIKLGLAQSLSLGNLEARRDWGHSREFVGQMHAMLQLDTPEDFVIATGETHTVREFCEIAFGELGLDYRGFVCTDPRFIRPSEVELLVGDASKALRQLGWEAQIRFPDLVREMVRADYDRLKVEKVH
jgi:GDPmannose 4,6-dehydratase